VKTKTKILILLVALVLAGVGIYASTVYAKRGVVTVQTARVVRQDLVSQVTASGEIKPKEYITSGRAPSARSPKCW
jgi:HlyD family secretion protein